MTSALPHLECRFGNPGAVSANAVNGLWGTVLPAFLKETTTGNAPKQSTWFKTLWTERELRVLFHAEDHDAWATLTARDDALYTEEVVEVFLDPFGDLENYFEIEVNPLNAVCDLVLRRVRSGYKKDFAWHCENLQTAVTKTATTWTTEISIPFESLAPGLPVAGKPWRANFFRIDRPKNAPRELSAWSPTGRPNFHVQQKFGFVEFVR